MKKCFLPVFICFSLFAQADFWTQKATYPGAGASRPYSFSIGSKGYFGCGDQSSSASDFWEYDQSSNSWVQKAAFGGGNRWSGVCFTVGGKGYAGTGWGSSMMSDFWEYNPTANTWTQVANYAPGKRQVSAGFSLDNFGYIACGRDSSNTFLSDMWRYDPSINGWTQMANFPGVARSNLVAFAVSGKGYVGAGFNQSLTALNDFYEYNPATNSWTAIASLPGTPRGDASAFSIGVYGYVGTGQVLPPFNTVLSDFWRYDPATNSWAQKATFSGVARDETGYFSIGNKGYIGAGSLNGNAYYSDFWEYTPDTATSVSDFDDADFDFTIYPNPVKNKLSVSGSSLNGSVVVVNVFDVVGNILIRTNFKTENNKLQTVLDVSQLAPGNYFIELTRGDRTISKRFLKN